ncbi:MAG: hypothetical protein R6T98_04680 [Desulfatiglandales bacterium]
MKNLVIFTIPKKTMDFFERTGGRVLKRPTREPRPPARRAYAPEGTEKKPIVFRSIGVMQRSQNDFFGSLLSTHKDWISHSLMKHSFSGFVSFLRNELTYLLLQNHRNKYLYIIQNTGRYYRKI